MYFFDDMAYLRYDKAKKMYVWDEVRLNARLQNDYFPDPAFEEKDVQDPDDDESTAGSASSDVEDPYIRHRADSESGSVNGDEASNKDEERTASPGPDLGATNLDSEAEGTVENEVTEPAAKLDPVTPSRKHKSAPDARFDPETNKKLKKGEWSTPEVRQLIDVVKDVFFAGNNQDITSGEKWKMVGDAFHAKHPDMFAGREDKLYGGVYNVWNRTGRQLAGTEFDERKRKKNDSLSTSLQADRKKQKKRKRADDADETSGTKQKRGKKTKETSGASEEADDAENTPEEGQDASNGSKEGESSSGEAGGTSGTSEEVNGANNSSTEAGDAPEDQEARNTPGAGEDTTNLSEGDASPKEAGETPKDQEEHSAFQPNPEDAFNLPAFLVDQDKELQAIKEISKAIMAIPPPKLTATQKESIRLAGKTVPKDQKHIKSEPRKPEDYDEAPPSYLFEPNEEDEFWEREHKEKVDRVASMARSEHWGFFFDQVDPIEPKEVEDSKEVKDSNNVEASTTQ